jgi:hypothetical protein
MLFRREFLLVGIIALLMFTAAHGQTHQWKTYDGSRFGFAAIFPHKPFVSTSTQNGIPVTDVSIGNNIETYRVTIAPIRSGDSSKAILQDLVRATRNDLKAEHKVISSDEDASYENVPSWVLASSDGSKFLVTQFFVTKRAVYVVEAEVLHEAMRKSPVYEEYMLKFFDSFKTI